MAIDLATEYEYAVPPSAEYPGGSFKNDSTGAANDGTPLDKQWANDFLGFFQAVLAIAGTVPSGAPDTAQASQYLESLEAIMHRPADTKWCFNSSVERRWLELAGGTIGDGDAWVRPGVEGRANPDTWPLFSALWTLQDGHAGAVLYAAGGAEVAMGVSAAADYAAHRAIGLKDMRGMFPRGWDHGRGIDPDRVLGSDQLDSLREHSHDSRYSNLTPSNIDGVGAGTEIGGAGTDWTYPTSPTGGTETRPFNTAGIWKIRY